uniref:Uncharacterized protein n=1 Tax=Aegilops tauschii TaxID=37682 RepID=N1QRD1_AEGTA
MPEDNASCLLCAKDAFFFVDTTASTCTTAEQDGGWYSGAEEESASSSAAAFVAELIGGEADYSPLFLPSVTSPPLSDSSDRLRRPRCSGRLHCMDSQGARVLQIPSPDGLPRRELHGPSFSAFKKLDAPAIRTAGCHKGTTNKGRGARTLTLFRDAVHEVSCSLKKKTTRTDEDVGGALEPSLARTLKIFNSKNKTKVNRKTRAARTSPVAEGQGGQNRRVPNGSGQGRSTGSSNTDCGQTRGGGQSLKADARREGRSSHLHANYTAVGPLLHACSPSRGPQKGIGGDDRRNATVLEEVCGAGAEV